MHTMQMLCLVDVNNKLTLSTDVISASKLHLMNDNGTTSHCCYGYIAKLMLESADMQVMVDYTIVSYQILHQSSLRNQIFPVDLTKAFWTEGVLPHSIFSARRTVIAHY